MMRPRMSLPCKSNKNCIDRLIHPVYDTEKTAMPWECSDTRSECYVMMPKRKDEVLWGIKRQVLVMLQPGIILIKAATRSDLEV